MKHIFVLVLLITGLLQSAQPQTRYIDAVSDEIIVETFTYVSKDGENLDLDVYRPEFDSEFERATLIYVHGGGFQSGKRDRDDIKKFCTGMAEYGYVVASISYRLTRKDKEGEFGCDCPAIEKLNTFNAAVEDIQDATYFLIENRESIGINPQQIILAGSSAGAEAVLNAAYQPPFCYGLDSGPVSYAGVISMAGAIPDTTAIYDESAIPSLFFHGTDDKLVPYGTAPHHYCNENDNGYLVLHGPNTIAKKLEKLGVPFWLHTTCGGRHELASKPMTEYFDEIVAFCYEFIVTGEGENRYTVVKDKQQNQAYEHFKICAE
jgi:acetyl esterase/lipase